MRRIVPDTSVMIAAFYPELIFLGGSPFDLSARARPIAQSIATRTVHGFGPDVLFAEFLTTAARFAFDRSGVPVAAADDVRISAFDFLSLPLTSVPARKIVSIAVELVFSERISPPDASFVAAALHADAELWYSHRHHDGVVEAAERLRPNQVFTLTEHRFK